MQDFLKDRPVVSPQDAPVIGAEPKVANAHVDRADAAPFSDLRKPAAPAAGNPSTARVHAAPISEAQSVTGDHGTRVQTVVERGRVIRIIVTCACGKVTEIGCQY